LIRNHVCAAALANEAAQSFSAEEMREPVLRGRQELRNPCTQRGPLHGHEQNPRAQRYMMGLDE
jgi:hypothetical protein